MRDGWTKCTLGELLTTTNGSIKTGPFGTVLRASEYSDIGTPLISAGEIGYGRLQLNERTPRVDVAVTGRLSEYLLEEHDIVFARKGTIDRSSLVKKSEAGYFLGSDGLRVRVGRGVDAAYISYQLLSQRSRAWLRQHAGGTTMPSLNQRVLSNMPIMLPSLGEQRRIAGVLGALDDLIDTNRALRDKALDLACGLYERSVQNSYRDVLLGECGQWLSGGTPSTSDPSYWDGDIPWISASSLHSFFVRSSDRRVTPTGASNGTRLVPAGSILFVVRGMSLKSEFRLGVAQREVAFGQDCKAIIIGEGMPPATIAVGLLAASDVVLKMVDEAGHGTGRLQTELIEALPIRIPPAAQAVAVERSLSALLAAGAAADDEISDLVRTRDELLPLVVSGRIRVRDLEGAA